MYNARNQKNLANTLDQAWFPHGDHWHILDFPMPSITFARKVSSGLRYALAASNISGEKKNSTFGSVLHLEFLDFVHPKGFSLIKHLWSDLRGLPSGKLT